MKPGDLVITVSAPGEKRDDGLVGLIGLIIRPVTLEDGSLIKSWCDWWVMIEGKPETWAEENLRLVNEDTDGYDRDKENQ